MIAPQVNRMTVVATIESMIHPEVVRLTLNSEVNPPIKASNLPAPGNVSNNKKNLSSSWHLMK